MCSTSVLVPLYIYPLNEHIPSIWQPLINAYVPFVMDLTCSSVRTYPKLNFTVVINPNSGPDGRPDLPDSQYQRAVPYFQGYANVRLVGYVSTLYAKRAIKDSLNDIDLYWRWKELSLAKTAHGSMALDGIFIDEVDWNGDKLDYFKTLYGHIKGKLWKTNKPGRFNKFRFLIEGYVILNPGCAPWHNGYYSIADLVIVFEDFYRIFTTPPLDDRPFQYLAERNIADGMRLMVPQSSSTIPSFKLAVMIHDFLPTQSRVVKLTQLRTLVYDLVQVKGLGAIFITDLQIKKEDVYADWSSFWQEFIGFIAQACCVTDVAT